MDKFKVGDRVRIINGVRSTWIGRKATITLSKHSHHVESLDRVIDGYGIDIDGQGITSPNGFLWHQPEDWLAPLYDGYEKTTWEELAPYWRPQVLEEV